MRLLNTQTLRLEEFFAEVPPYAILSHCWGKDEVTFEDVQDLFDSGGAIEHKVGWQKVRSCCRQTLREGFHYVWIDTCCINKSSSAELSEAINSMFRWYRDAVVCFAYLADVPNLSDDRSFIRSRWFKRGWTLQELIAPREVMFLDAFWHSSSSRRLMANRISQCTGIDTAMLLGSRPLRSYSVAQRFSWAARRRTTRLEDQAYSLLGLFGVHMPLLYGEGSNAFVRLQEEVLRVEQDLSILAWSIPSYTDSGTFEERILPLAPSVTFFTSCRDIVSAISSDQLMSESPDIEITAHSVRLTTKVITVSECASVLGRRDRTSAVLNCRHAKDITKLIAMELHPVSQSSDTASMQSSETLKVKVNNRIFFLRDRIMLVDVFDGAKFGVTRTITIQRVRPWSEVASLGKEAIHSHLWVRFDEPLLDRSWKTLEMFPKQHWTPENRTFDLSAAFAEEKDRVPVGRKIQHSAYSIRTAVPVYAAIVLSDGSQDQVVVYIRMQHPSPFHTKIDFRLDPYHPDSYAPLKQNFEPLADNMSQSIQLRDGTYFVVQIRDDLVTDKLIAHLAVTLERQSPNSPLSENFKASNLLGF